MSGDIVEYGMTFMGILFVIFIAILFVWFGKIGMANKHRKIEQKMERSKQQFAWCKENPKMCFVLGGLTAIGSVIATIYKAPQTVVRSV